MDGCTNNCGSSDDKQQEIKLKACQAWFVVKQWLCYALRGIWSIILIILGGIAWCLCKVVYHLLNWAEKFDVRNSSAKGFATLETKILKRYDGVKDHFQNGWKSVVEDCRNVPDHFEERTADTRSGDVSDKVADVEIVSSGVAEGSGKGESTH